MIQKISSDPQTVKNYVNSKFSSFGLTKRQEISRLLYEIAKRELCDFKSVVQQAGDITDQFAQFKKYLSSRRFPGLSEAEQKNHKLVELSVDQQNRADIAGVLDMQPKHFVVEKSVKDTSFVMRLQEKFPKANFEYTSKYKEHVQKKRFEIKDYNDRRKTFYIIREEYDFFKKCPCSSKSVSCGLHVVNLGSGCAFECSYCYLQDYINSQGIILPANIEDFFEQFKSYKQNVRICSGEITDSLVFDHITGHSAQIVNFFRDYPESFFEFKTKSNNINNLLSVEASSNIIVGWSLNPQNVIETTEFYTASLDERLEAAYKCMKAGYKIAFHFDPMIYYQGWEEDYKALVDRVLTTFDHDCFEWFSIGTLRMTPKLKKIIENRFPQNTILDEEFITGYDGKYRYPFKVRTQMYSKIKEWIHAHNKDIYFYLCMEEKDACGTCEAGPLKKHVPV